MQNLLTELEHINLSQIPVMGGDKRLNKTGMPNQGGVYCFWWVNNTHPLQANHYLNPIPSIGPGNQVVSLPVENDYFVRKSNGAIPLYVGKTNNLSKRFGQHLMLGTERTASYDDYNIPIKRRNSSCQFRHGMDMLFHEIDNTRQLTLDENRGQITIVSNIVFHAFINDSQKNESATI